MNVAKKQHWVPQFYLRHFATSESAASQVQKIWACEIDKADPFMASVSDVAAKRFLYSTLDEEGGERNHEIEQRLAAFESEFSKFWADFILGKYRLDDACRSMVGLFIANLYLRHPRMLERQTLFHQRVVEAVELVRENRGGSEVETVKINQFEFDRERWERFRELTDEGKRAAWGQNVFNMALEFVRHLRVRSWSMFISHKRAFITSDQPVTLLNDVVPGAALSTPGTTILFPVSPERLLVINSEKYRDGWAYKGSDASETAFNYFVASGAHRFVFAPQPPNYTLRQYAVAAKLAEESESKRQRLREAVERNQITVGRNDPCPCGSGRKYKRCCGD